MYVILTENKTESVLMVVGLGTHDGPVQDVYHISLERPDRVRMIGETPAHVRYAAAVEVIDNTLYAVGIGLAFNELWKWNAASDWTRCADMTSCRRWHCVAAVDSTLYALGGWVDADSTTLSSVEAYNTQANKWSAAGPLTHAVRLAACVSYNDSIYVFGGMNATGKPVNHVQVYNTAQNNCTLLQPAMPRAYAWMRAVVWKTYAVLLGPDTCFIYNFETETWQERKLFRTRVHEFGLVLDKKTLFIAGGSLPPTEEVLSVSVRDVIADKQGSRWTYHATLPTPAALYAFGLVLL